MILEITDGVVLVGLILTLLFWITPVILFLNGLEQLKTKPGKAKIMMIVSGIWLLIGLGCCGAFG